MHDLVLRNVRIAGGEPNAPLRDIGISQGRIAAIGTALLGREIFQLKGALVTPGLIESHIHLDKSRILDRCTAAPYRGTDHMKRVSAVKPGFTVEDIYARAAASLESCILHGCTHMRSHVEVDPNVGLKGFEAMKQLARDYAWAIDLELCAFLQEGWSDIPEADRNLVACLEQGACVVGGAPAYDRNGPAQIDRIFELAKAYDYDVDIHLDVGFSAENLAIHQVCALTDKIGWGGRVTVGHGSKYSAMSPAQLAALGAQLAKSGVALTVLPSTDLYTVGRHMEHSVMRGVADANALIEAGANCCLSTNNILNPFTPFGDGSLMRMANLYANIIQRGTDAELEECLAMVTERPARVLRRKDYGIAIGNPADLVVWDATRASEAVATNAPALMGFKAGRQSFSRAKPILHRP